MEVCNYDTLRHPASTNSIPLYLIRLSGEFTEISFLASQMMSHSQPSRQIIGAEGHRRVISVTIIIQFWPMTTPIPQSLHRMSHHNVLVVLALLLIPKLPCHEGSLVINDMTISVGDLTSESGGR